MPKRPALPLDAQAAVEQARKAVFDSAEKRFDLLFYPRFDISLFSGVQIALDVPYQRMPATVKQQLRDYTISLFAAEAQQREPYATTAEEFREWLTEIAGELDVEIRQVAAKDRLDFHCAKAERFEIIENTLREEIKRWVEAKSAKRPTAIPVVLEKPLTLTERLDRAAVRLNVSHDGLAELIGISRTVYYDVKAGGGGRVSRTKVEEYLANLEKSGLNPD